MKKSLLLFIFLGVLIVVFSVSAQVSAQKTAPKAGGYKEISKNDREVAAAAEFAAQAQAKKIDGTVTLISVEHAESQVVAGMNYRLCLKVETEDPNENVTIVQTVKTIVYRNLKKEYSLTSWQEEDCAESEDESN